MADAFVGLPLQLASTIILARLLTPAETGVYAVAAVFSSFAANLRDFGVGEYLIQERELDNAKIAAALTLNIAISWAVGLILFFAAPFLANFYRNAGIEEVLRTVCFNFALIPFGAVTMAYFRRELTFKPVLVASLLANIATFGVSIACALRGMGYMSLAWSSLAGVVVTVATALWYRPEHFPRWPALAGIGRVFHFGKYASGIYVFGQLGKGAPEMIIGRAQGVADVAMFSRGGGLVELFNRLVLRGITPVCLPYFAKGQREQGSVSAGYLVSMSYVTVVGWPALLFLGTASYPLVLILYGGQWVQGAALAKPLCLAAAFELVHYFSKEALLGAGDAKCANNLQAMTQGAKVLGLLAAVPFGLQGACWGLVAAGLVDLLVAQRALRQRIELTWTDLLGACSKSASVTIATAVPLLSWSFFVPVGSHNYIWWTIVAGSITVLAWLCAVRLLAHPLWAEATSIARPLLDRFLKR